MRAAEFPDGRYDETAGSSTSAHASDRVLVWSIALVLFLLAAANGHPAWWSSGVHLAVLAPLIIFVRGPAQVLNFSLNRANRLITASLAALLLATLISAIVNLNVESYIAFFERSFAPFVLYLAAIGLRLRQKDHEILIMGLCAGTLFLFLRGLFAYYDEFGVPSFETLMWSRFEVNRIASYTDVTLGNVTRMGSYFILVVPPLIYALLVIMRGRLNRLLLWITTCTGLANLLISGARTGIFLFVVAMIMVAMAANARKLMTASILACVIAALTAPIWIQSTVGGELVERFTPSLSYPGVDNSAADRLESVEQGLDVFFENPFFGLGPESSTQHNYFTVPHQSMVHVLSEVGLFGGLAFLILNIVVIIETVLLTIVAFKKRALAFRYVWLIGPALWLIYGQLAGIAFNASFALVWMGLFSVMVALARATLVSDED